MKAYFLLNLQSNVCEQWDDGVCVGKDCSCACSGAKASICDFPQF